MNETTLLKIAHDQLYVSIRKLHDMTNKKILDHLKYITLRSMFTIKIDREILPYLNNQLPKNQRTKIKHLKTNEITNEIIEIGDKLQHTSISKILEVLK